LRALGFCYLVTVGFFALAIATADQARLHDAMNKAGEAAEDRIGDDLLRPVLAFVRLLDEKIFDPPRPHVVIALPPPGSDDMRIATKAHAPPRAPVRLIDRPRPPPDLTELAFIAPDLPQFEIEEDTGTGRAAASGEGLRATPARLQVKARLEQSLTPELREHFDLFLFVSKGARGAAAQRLYVFRKEKNGDLTLIHDWAASTGRERYEISPQGRRAFTATPGGLYQLDPKRMYRRYQSRAWNGPMPYAMFFDWEQQGVPSGVAIHGTVGTGIAKLGRRASAGCIHISLPNAKRLFDLIRRDYGGHVPRFAYDQNSNATSHRGELMRDAGGDVVMGEGYRVLVDVEDLSAAHSVAQLYGETLVKRGPSPATE
jgi:hypothetical protein